MGYIKEPEGIDLVVGPSILTEQDKLMISNVIANYKQTGKKPNQPKNSVPHVQILKHRTNRLA
jgi:hypothetical protein